MQDLQRQCLKRIHLKFEWEHHSAPVIWILSAGYEVFGFLLQVETIR